jgi:hypothetical protein
MTENWPARIANDLEELFLEFAAYAEGQAHLAGLVDDFWKLYRAVVQEADRAVFGNR